MEKEQEQQQQPLFRQKSLERISSPEQLHDYMRVTTPRLWMILGAIVALLVGFIVYASTTRMESTVDVKVRVSSYNYLTANIPDSARDIIAVDMPVRIEGLTGTISTKDQGSYYCVKMALDSGDRLEDDLYFMLAEDADPRTDTDVKWLLVTYENGEFLIDPDLNNQDILKALQDGSDLRMRFWIMDYEETDDSVDLVYRPGRLATVSGLGTVVTTTVSIRLDDPEARLEAGVYDAEIVTESTTPISFLLN